VKTLEYAAIAVVLLIAVLLRIAKRQDRTIAARRTQSTGETPDEDWIVHEGREDASPPKGFVHLPNYSAITKVAGMTFYEAAMTLGRTPGGANLRIVRTIDASFEVYAAFAGSSGYQKIGHLPKDLGQHLNLTYHEDLPIKAAIRKYGAKPGAAFAEIAVFVPAAKERRKYEW
jgi:hypothetical protein